MKDADLQKELMILFEGVNKVLVQGDNVIMEIPEYTVAVHVWNVTHKEPRISNRTWYDQPRGQAIQLIKEEAIAYLEKEPEDDLNG